MGGARAALEMARVLADEDLPFAAVSAAVSARALFAALPQPPNPQDKVGVGLDSEGRLWADCGIARLVRSLPLARDFHMCTVLLERNPRGDLYLQTARPLRAGEPLYLWFSTDIQALLGISFLAPTNIRGEKNYRCHYCGDNFEYPNPLKLHIALDCEKTKLCELWRRLEEALTNNNHRTSEDWLVGDRGSPTGSARSSPPAEPDRLAAEWRPASEPPRAASRTSAFRPYLGGDHPAARIEQLVSNLGQSKQGHLCLYCGKVYSRKYGLKIHIRTHTGFKPLKCKYCLRPFGDPSNLNKHVRLHSESETPYRCELCRKMLVRKRDLERHMKSRHNTPKIS